MSNDIVSLYNSGKSLDEIAELVGHSKSTVYRKLKQSGAIIRNKSQAQKNALLTGKSEHPTKGKKRPDAVKEKVSNYQANFWKTMSDDERQRRAEISKENWDKMSETSKQLLRDKSYAAIRESAKSGSKLEKFLHKTLQNYGYNVIFHKTALVSNTQLEIDLIIPELKTIIEVDGPSHFLPVWGEDKLKSVIKSDAEKNGLLLREGYVVIRLRHDGDKLSQYDQRHILKQMHQLLQKISNKFPEPNERYIEIYL